MDIVNLVMKKVKLDAKQVSKINRQNRLGKPWKHENGKEINLDFIVKCYDLYKQGRMTSKRLLATFPGRTMSAIQSKVWKIRGRATEKTSYDPNQTSLFTKLLDS